MRQAGAFSILRVSFVASCLVLVALLVSPVWAQATDDDPLAGVDVTLAGPDDGSEVNQVLVPLTDCTIAADASVTVRNLDSSGQPTGPPIELVNDEPSVQIEQEQTQIIIERADQDTLNPELQSGDGEVVESTGFTCGDDTDTNTDPAADDNAGGDAADDQQYGDREEGVMVETVPEKPLPKTGGFPVLLGAGLMLVAATVLGSRMIGRR